MNYTYKSIKLDNCIVQFGQIHFEHRYDTLVWSGGLFYFLGFKREHSEHNGDHYCCFKTTSQFLPLLVGPKTSTLCCRKCISFNKRHQRMTFGKRISFFDQREEFDHSGLGQDIALHWCIGPKK